MTKMKRATHPSQFIHQGYINRGLGEFYFSTLHLFNRVLSFHNLASKPRLGRGGFGFIPPGDYNVFNLFLDEIPSTHMILCAMLKPALTEILQ